MAGLSEADILRILDLIDRSSFDYFELTYGDIHLKVSKTGLPPEAASGTAPAPRPASEAPAAPPPPPAAAPATPPAAAPEPPAAAASAPPGLVPICSPMVGTFYVAPAPDAPPFVEVGSVVLEDTTVGLVEAMKVFTSVVAGVRGVIAQRVAENAQFVEYGQPLFLVRPETS